MNPALTLTLTGSIKKQIGIVVATLVVIVALPVMAVFSMGQNVLSFLSAAPSAEAAETQGFYMGGPVDGDTYEWGNCTYWAFAQRLWVGKPIPTTWGNANTWDDQAAKDGYKVDHIPEPGAIFQTDDGKWGHVAFVKEVNPTNGEWKITEMNVVNLNVVSERTFSAKAANYYNFIHDRLKL
ncbi:CHAP domain-containing protein [Candidatus Dojkabacteria bacterium]|uniref:CHAP domain-containing protein n=1 Tax=Candidatus Dojkabacteria bacterium TaxID=2099670 RepID=A0A5C7J2W4_9BACT|nr:MAG: CHAP domain-containing protein [Candidatus Dojkabacteria bacterium]